MRGEIRTFVVDRINRLRITEISFKVAGLDEIRQWVLSMGPEAVVAEPAELKVSVRKSLKETLDQYSGISEDEIGTEVFDSQSKYAS